MLCLMDQYISTAVASGRALTWDVMGAAAKEHKYPWPQSLCMWSHFILATMF